VSDPNPTLLRFISILRLSFGLLVERKDGDDRRRLAGLAFMFSASILLQILFSKTNVSVDVFYVAGMCFIQQLVAYVIR
ncbi:hypothetical protein BHE74_00024055, partial [Ensete ventricosum]